MNEMIAPDPATPPHSSRIVAVAFLLTGFFIYLAYSNTFSSPPVLDDFHTFVEQPLVRIEKWSVENISLLSGTMFSWNRWIPMISFSLDLSLGKGEVYFFHLTNFAIHFSCFLSVAFLIYQLAHAAQKNDASLTKEQLISPGSLSIWVAGLWALHPLQTNAVTYLVQRMASLVALFTVLSVAFYVSGRLATARQGHCNVKALAYFVLSIVSAIVAFLCKENSVMIPVLLVFSEAWFFQPGLFGRLFATMRKRWLLSGVLGLIVLAAFSYILSTRVLPGYENRNFTMLQRLLTQPRVLLWYISVLFWPHPGRLSLEHDVVISTSLFHPVTTILSTAILSILGWWTIARRRDYPLITYGVLWFILNMVVESTFIPLELVFEHRMYLPSVGLLLTIIAGAQYFLCPRLHSFNRRDLLKLSWSFFAILASLLTLTTFQRNNSWKDGITIAYDNVLKAPMHHRSHANLAVALTRHQRWQEAIDEAYTSITLGKINFESYAVATNVIIMAYTSMGEYQASVNEGERLLEEKPAGLNAVSLPAVHLNLALAYEVLGNLQDAVNHVRQALNTIQLLPKGRAVDLKTVGAMRLEHLLSKAAEDGVDLDGRGVPDLKALPIATRMAQELLKVGDRSAARDYLKRAVMEDEGDAEANRLLAVMAHEDSLNGIQESKKDFTGKYVLRPFTPYDLRMAMAFLIQKYRLPAPFSSLGETVLGWNLRLQPDSADGHLLKGWYLYSKNEAEPAVQEAQHALRLDPEYARAWLGLGFFLLKANRPQEALASFEKTLELYPGLPQRTAINNVINTLQGSTESMAKGTDSSLN